MKRKPDGSKHRLRRRPPRPGEVRKKEFVIKGGARDVPTLLRETFPKVVALAAEELDEQIAGAVEARAFDSFLEVPLAGVGSIKVSVSGHLACVHGEKWGGCRPCLALDDQTFDYPMGEFDRQARRLFGDVLEDALEVMARQNLERRGRPFLAWREFFLLETGHKIVVSIDGRPDEPPRNFVRNDPALS